jgi:hypothetical protein
MKLIWIMAMAIVPLRLPAQSNTIEVSPEPSLDWWATELVAESLAIPNARPAQGGTTYTGIGGQLIQAEQPLQLLNPLAPKSYGTGDQNLILDMFTKQPVGLKLFSLNF